MIENKSISVKHIKNETNEIDSKIITMQDVVEANHNLFKSSTLEHTKYLVNYTYKDTGMIYYESFYCPNYWSNNRTRKYISDIISKVTLKETIIVDLRAIKQEGTTCTLA